MTYSIGLDCALGIEGKDFDAGILFDANHVQVATIRGHWGESFARVLVPLLDWFNPFIVGEAAKEGIPILRALYDTGRYWLYFHRREQTRGRKIRDMLGHVPLHNDITIRWLQEKIAPRDERGNLLPPAIVVKDEELLNQLCLFGYKPRSAAKTYDEVRDDGLTWGCPSGEHDDLVRACALAVAGLEWLPKFERPKPRLPANSIGAFLDHDKPDPAKKGYWR